MLLRVETDKEGRHVDDLLANGDVALSDEDTSMVNGAGQAELENLGLETTLQEILNGKSQDVIELHLVLGKNTRAHQTADKSITLEQTLGVLLVTSQKITGSTTDLGELETNAVDFTLVTETVLAAELQLSRKTGRLVRTLRSGIGLGVDTRHGRHGLEQVSARVS